MAVVNITPEGITTPDGKPVVNTIAKRKPVEPILSSPGGGFEKNEGNSWIPWALGGGGALLSHAIASSLFDDSEEDKRKESLWMRLLRTLIPLGVGAAGAYGGYRLGESLNNGTMKMGEEYEIPNLHYLTNSLGGIVHAPVTFSQDEFSDLEKRYPSVMSDPSPDKPLKLLEMDREGNERKADLSRHIGTGLETIGLGTAVGAPALAYLKKQAPIDPDKLEDLRRQVESARNVVTNAKKDLRAARSAARPTGGTGWKLWKAPRGEFWRNAKQVAGDRLKYILGMDPSVSAARQAVSAAKSDLAVAKGALPATRAQKAVRGGLVGAGIAGAGLIADRIGRGYGDAAVKAQGRIDTHNENIAEINRLRRLVQEAKKAKK